MSSILPGVLGMVFSAFLLGTNFVPVKKYRTYDGILFQWYQSSGTVVVGLCLAIIIDWRYNSGPEVPWEGLLGGCIYSLCVALFPLVCRLTGLAVGFVSWTGATVVMGWAVGRFGLWNLPRQEAKMPIIDYVGVSLCFIAIMCMLLVKPDNKTIQTLETKANYAIAKRTKKLLRKAQKKQKQKQQKQEKHENQQKHEKQHLLKQSKINNKTFESDANDPKLHHLLASSSHEPSLVLNNVNSISNLTIQISSSPTGIAPVTPAAATAAAGAEELHQSLNKTNYSHVRNGQNNVQNNGKHVQQVHRLQRRVSLQKIVPKAAGASSSHDTLTTPCIEDIDFQSDATLATLGTPATHSTHSTQSRSNMTNMTHGTGRSTGKACSMVRPHSTQELSAAGSAGISVDRSDLFASAGERGDSPDMADFGDSTGWEQSDTPSDDLDDLDDMNDMNDMEDMYDDVRDRRKSSNKIFKKIRNRMGVMRNRRIRRNSWNDFEALQTGRIENTPIAYLFGGFLDYEQIAVEKVKDENVTLMKDLELSIDVRSEGDVTDHLVAFEQHHDAVGPPHDHTASSFMKARRKYYGQLRGSPSLQYESDIGSVCSSVANNRVELKLANKKNKKGAGGGGARGGQLWKLFGSILAVLQGVISGNCSTFYLYWRENHSEISLNYVFAYYLGIYLGATAMFIVMGLYRKARQKVWKKPVIRPAFFSGAMYGVGYGAMLYSANFLPFPVVFVVCNVGAIMVSNLWSILYFKEVTEKSSLRVLMFAITLMSVGIVAEAIASA